MKNIYYCTNKRILSGDQDAMLRQYLILLQSLQVYYVSGFGVFSSRRMLAIVLKRGLSEVLKNMPKRQIFKEFDLLVYKRDGVSSSRFIWISVGTTSLPLKLKLIKLH